MRETEHFHEPEPLSRRDAWALLAICAVAAAVRYYGLSARDLWLDEAYSLRFSAVPLGAFLRTIAHADQHPPLYYLVLKAAVAVAGQSETVLRLPSLLCSVLTVPAIYLLARRGGGRSAATCAALLFAFSAVHVRYAQEARMYALQVCAISWSLFGLLRALASARVKTNTPVIPSESREAGRVAPSVIPSESREAGRVAPSVIPSESREAGRVEGWMLYAGGALVALYSQNTTLVYIACTSAAVLALVLAKKLSARPALPSLGLTLAAILAGWVPWAPYFFEQATQVTTQFWIPRPDAASVLRTFEALYLPLPGVTAIAIRAGVLALLLVVLVRGVRSVRLPGWSWPLLSVLLLGPTLLLLASIRTPLFIPRAILWTTVPFFAFAGIAVSSARRVPVRVGMVTFLGALSIATVLLYHTSFTKEQWRAAAVSAASMAGPGELVLVHASAVSLPFRYYFDATGSKARVLVLPAFSLDGAWEPAFGPADEAAVRELTKHREPLVLVYSHFEYSDPGRRLAALLDSLYAHRDTRTLQGIELRRYWN
jgi:uncharacterized membrane protein